MERSAAAAEVPLASSIMTTSATGPENSTLTTTGATSVLTSGPPNENNSAPPSSAFVVAVPSIRARGRPPLTAKADKTDQYIREISQRKRTTNARIIQEELARRHNIKLSYEVIRRRIKKAATVASAAAATLTSEDSTSSMTDSTNTTRLAATSEPNQVAAPTGSVPTADRTKELHKSSDESQKKQIEDRGFAEIAKDLDMLAETVRVIVNNVTQSLNDNDEEQDIEPAGQDTGAQVQSVGSHVVEQEAEVVAHVEETNEHDEHNDTERLDDNSMTVEHDIDGEPDEEPANIVNSHNISDEAFDNAHKRRYGYSPAIRQLCVQKNNSGMNYRQIAAELNMPVSSVQTIIRKAKAAGDAVPPQRAGRPRVIDDSVEQLIFKFVQKNPNVSARSIHDELAKTHQLGGVSFETIRRRVRDCRKKLIESALGGTDPPCASSTSLMATRNSNQELGVTSTSDESYVIPQAESSVLSSATSEQPATIASIPSVLPAKRKKNSEYSTEIRELCVHKHEVEGLSYVAIANELLIPHDTVRAIVRKAKKTGTVVSAPRSGRPRKTSGLIDKVILQAVKTNQRSTAKMIQEDLWRIFNVKVSSETVRRRVKAHTKQRLLLSSAGEKAESGGQEHTIAEHPSELQSIISPALTTQPVILSTAPVNTSYEMQAAGLVIPEENTLLNQVSQPVLNADHTNTIIELQPPPAKKRKKRADYSIDLREKCVELHAQGHGYRRIGQELGMPHTTVRAIVEKVQRTGTVLPAPRSGRPRKTNDILDKVILQAVKTNHKSSARMIQEELLTAYDVRVSCETIRRRVKDHTRQRYASSVPSVFLPDPVPKSVAMGTNDPPPMSESVQMHQPPPDFLQQQQQQLASPPPTSAAAMLASYAEFVTF